MSEFMPFRDRAGMRISFGLGMAFIIVLAIFPAAAVLGISFTDIRGLPYIPVRWVGLDNYATFFSAAKIGYNVKALQNTLVFAGAVTILQNLIALLIAVLFSGKLRGRTFYRAVVFMPTVLGVTVTGLIWSLIFNPSAGPAASIWSWFGASSAFLGDPSMAMSLVVLVQVWAGVGLAVIIFIAGIQAIPGELYEAAAIDGAGPWQRLRRITIPLLAPSVTANVLLCLVSSLQSYQLIYVLTGPKAASTQVLSLAVFTQSFGNGALGGSSQSQGYAAAISMVQFVIVGVITLVVLTYLRRREAKL
ncbi:MAG: carbohydrate ABC transporter permease [Actinoallomurus sp.]